MDVPALLGVINDLPSTFTRNGPPYTQFVDATATALNKFTAGADGTWTQVLSYVNGPQDGWLDTWGLLWGVPREVNEANVSYATRLQETMLAWMCTFPSLQAWVNLFAPGGSVTENLPDVGYVIVVPASMTTAQINNFIISLGRIRPAGVPFIVVQVTLGLYLGTDNFMGSGSRVAGDYLTGASTPLPLPMGPNTLSARVLLPGLLMEDPTINPSLAP